MKPTKPPRMVFTYAELEYWKQQTERDAHMAKKQTTTWGGHRPNAGRKPGTIRLTPKEARSIVNLTASLELIQRLDKFAKAHEKKEESK